MKKEKLPTFKKFMEEGTHGILKSSIPEYTVPAWNCMLTGKNPGKIGAFGLLQKEPNSYNFAPYFLINRVERNSLFDILSENRKIVCAVNVPTIYTPYKVNGCMVVGWLGKENEVTYPRELKSELDNITKGYDIDIYWNGSNLRWRLEEAEEGEFLSKLYSVTEKRFLATEYLMDTYNWDFFMVVFEGPDRIQHKLWNNKNEILKYYQYLDEMLFEFYNRIGEDTIMILASDHGFGPQKYTFNINDWLLKNGFLKLKKDDSLSIKVKKILERSCLWRLGRCFFPGSFKRKIKRKIHTIRFSEAKIDWRKTKAFSYPDCGGIYINLKEREPEGSVELCEYEDIRNGIIAELKKLELNSQKVSARVLKREEIYHGKYLTQAPDLIIQLDDNIQGVSTTIGNESIFSHSRAQFGNHRINGIFLAVGPEIKRGYEISANIIDIAPTVLHILDVPIPRDMDGYVLKNIFEENSELSTKPTIFSKSGKDEREKIKRIIRLKIKNL